jgi:hypothetical protein
MQIELEALEILILLKCHQKLISRSYIATNFAKYPKIEREAAINNLIEHGLVAAKKMPKPGAKVIPIFYKITDKGGIWVKDYLDNYPKN